MKYNSFIFKSYSFDDFSKTVTFNYSFDNELNFTEKYFFDFDFVDFNQEALNEVLKSLFLLAGVSYYKAFIPKNIVIKPFSISKTKADFLSKTYQKGLREFFFTNNLPLNTPVDFPYDDKKTSLKINLNGDGKLVAIGGGKDSLVSVELLRKTNDEKIVTWSVGHKNQLRPLIERIGLKHFYIERIIDKKIIGLEEAYNGHVPISAIFAVTGAVVCVLTGYKDVVVSNESSADEPTLTYDGEVVNHQYSKSTEFEKSYQKLLGETFGERLRYYSLLRNYNEVEITKLFAENGFEKYKDVFCSCNQAFRQNQSKMAWCGLCPKCCFVFLALTPFVNKIKLEEVFGSNPLTNPSNEEIYNELLGKKNRKPFECVGTIDETHWAMNQAYSIYKGLADRFGPLDKNSIVRFDK